MYLNAAKCKKFVTAAEEDKEFYQPRSGGDTHGEYVTIHSYQDPLVGEYNLRAGELGIQAHFDRTRDTSYGKFEHEDEAHVPDETEIGMPGNRRLKIYANVESAQPYKLRPECRKCYELFASFEGLEHHLQRFP